MTIRVYGKLVNHDESPIAGEAVIVTGAGYNQTAFSQLPGSKLAAITDEDGNYEFKLWLNGLGDYDAGYCVKFPRNNARYEFSLPVGTPSEIGMSEVLLANASPNTPQYEAIIALINRLFSEGSFVGAADIVPLAPQIPGYGTTVQSALQTIANKNLPAFGGQADGVLISTAGIVRYIPHIDGGTF